MKKTFTLIALSAMMLMPSTVMADWTKYVTTKNEFTAAVNSIDGGLDSVIIAGAKNADGTYAVADANVVLNIGNYNMPTDEAGQMKEPDTKLVISSRQTDIDNLPRIQLGLNMFDMPQGNHFQLHIENVSFEYRTGNTVTSGQIIYWSGNDPSPYDDNGNARTPDPKKKPICDEIVIKNCQITNIPRTLFRSVPSTDWVEDNFIQPGEGATSDDWKAAKNAAKVQDTSADNAYMRYFELSGCKIHDMNLTNGNNWSLLVFGQAIDEIVIKDNLIYNLPWTKGLVEVSKLESSGKDTQFTFENNTVFVGNFNFEDATDANGAKGSKNKGFKLIGADANWGMQAEYNINNNIFWTPKPGTLNVLKHNSTNPMAAATVTIDEYQPAPILSLASGYVTAQNNVIDGWKPWSAGVIKVDGELAEWLQADTLGNYTLADADLSWDSFYNTESNNFLLEKSHKLYTMGAEGTCIGSPLMYVDKFPVSASLSVKVEGSRFVDVSINPEKDTYFNGDEVTITLIDHNSKYRTLNTFKGWNDGNMDNPRKVVIDGAVDLTATFEETQEAKSLVSFMDLSSVTARNNKVEKLTAEINASEDNKMVVHGFAIDANGNDDGNYVQALASTSTQVFQAVLNKFGEDPATDQMNALSRRTSADAHVAGKPNYARFELSTVNLSDIVFSCLVGSDNIGLKTQNADYSFDGETWTNFATVDLVQRPAVFVVSDEDVDGNLAGWNELKGQLPKEAEGKDVLYIRVISDPTSESLWAIPSLEATKDTGVMFEYVTSILVTADSEQSGISERIADATTANAAVYNLMGIKVGANARGLLISNGKKMLVK